jgi:hypothetical protein
MNHPLRSRCEGHEENQKLRALPVLVANKLHYGLVSATLRFMAVEKYRLPLLDVENVLPILNKISILGGLDDQ